MSKAQKYNRKKPFTLFEVLLVLMIMAIALGTLAFQVPKAWKKETFEGGVNRVISKLELAQELMMDTHLDVLLTLTTLENGLLCELTTQQPIAESFKKKLNRNTTIKGITEIGFDHTKTQKLILHFDHSLGGARPGTLILGAEGKEQKICLKGFPSRIARGEYVTENIQKTLPAL